MHRKRKRPDGDRSSAKLHKKEGQKVFLMDLPREILDAILALTIPDLKKFGISIEENSTKKLFTTPTLQISRALRRASLDFITARHEWIHIETPNKMLIEDVETHGGLWPFLPVQFRYLLPTRPPDIVLQFHYGRQSKKRAACSSNLQTLVLPYSLNNLLRICDILNDIIDDTEPDIKLHVDLENAYGSVKRDLYDFVVPVISTMWSPKLITYEVNGEKVSIRDKNISSSLTTSSLDDVTAKAKAVLSRALRIEEEGRFDESYLLLLFQNELLREAENVPPRPEEWNLGNEDCKHEASHDQSACCLHGNRLRDLIFGIEQKTFTGYFNLQRNDRKAWGPQRQLLDRFKDSGRAIIQPKFTWLGQSTSDLAKLHYVWSRYYGADDTVAVDDDELWRFKYQCMSYKPALPHIECLVQTFLAYHLDPRNEVYKIQYEKQQKKLNRDARKC